MGLMDAIGAGFETAAPPGVVMYRIDGPFFFGVAAHLNEILDRIGSPPKVFVLRLGHVPFIDASGAHALEEFINRCRLRGAQVILTHVQSQPLNVLKAMGIAGQLGPDGIADTVEVALATAQRLVSP